MSRILPGNEQLQTVVSYGVDPRGWALFCGVLGRAWQDLTGARVVIDARGDGNFSGWAQTMQRFTGLAGKAAGTQRAIAPTTGHLVNERSSTTDPVMRALYAQMLEGQR